jgi:hypothetical protein
MSSNIIDKINRKKRNDNQARRTNFGEVMGMWRYENMNIQ